MVYIANRSNLRIAKTDDLGISFLLSSLLERGREFSQAVDGDLIPHELVSLEYDRVVLPVDGNHRILEPVILPGGESALLGRCGVGVHVRARVALPGCYKVCRESLGNRDDLVLESNVRRQRAARAKNRKQRQHLDAAGDHELVLPGHYLGRPDIDSIKSRTAEA